MRSRARERLRAELMEVQADGEAIFIAEAQRRFGFDA
jgi:hypothetical protein